MRVVPRRTIGGAVYVLPNLFTTANLFWGFFSIVKCLKGEFGWAASAIVLAMVFDALDGRVARLTGGTSEFGVQYDSLCDLISFGLAPAFLMYEFGLNGLGRVGWVVCFLYLACGALRLARFNVQSAVGKANGDFTGLPIPMAAGVMAGYVALMVDLKKNLGTSHWVFDTIYQTLSLTWLRQGFLLVGGIILALAMVSNFAYRSHKSLHITSIKPFRLLVLLVLVMGLLAYQPELFGFTFMFLYALSGPFEWLVGWKKVTEEEDIFASHGDGESMIEPDYGRGDRSSIHSVPPKSGQDDSSSRGGPS